MDRIYYVGDSVLTGSAIAGALLEYAEALAKAQSAGTVAIPTRLADGAQGRSTFLVGPSSQIVSDTEHSDFAELVDDDLVNHLHDETRQLRFSGRSNIASAVPVGADEIHPLGALDDM
jgi:hypothetical protein